MSKETVLNIIGNLMIKAKNWKGNSLKGVWQVTLKIDGVRMLRSEKGDPVSRAGKKLHNLDHIPKTLTDCEIFCKDWSTSVAMVRTHNSNPVHPDNVYPLDPLDARLAHSIVEDPSSIEIRALLEAALVDGYEGLVLRQEDTWLKVKPSLTVDVFVTGHQEGTGKYTGKLGALLTDYGKVGTGLKDSERDADLFPIGTLIEVECMDITPAGKMRHPRFIRIREDKNEVSI